MLREHQGTLLVWEGADECPEATVGAGDGLHNGLVDEVIVDVSRGAGADLLSVRLREDLEDVEASL